MARVVHCFFFFAYVKENENEKIDDDPTCLDIRPLAWLNFFLVRGGCIACANCRCLNEMNGWLVGWLVGDRPSNSAISKSFTRKKIERKKCKRGGGGVVVAKKAQNMHYILFVGNILGNIIFRKVFFYVRYCFCSRIMAGAFFLLLLNRPSFFCWCISINEKAKEKKWLPISVPNFVWKFFGNIFFPLKIYRI